MGETTSTTRIDLDFAVVEREPGGFLHVVTKPVHHRLEEAALIVDIFRRIHAEEGVKARVLVDMRQVLSQSREARLLYQSEEVAEVCIAAALMVGSGLGRVVGNFAIGLNRGPVLARLFTDEHEARAWLESLKSDAG